jgi:hypothetical protein
MKKQSSTRLAFYLRRFIAGDMHYRFDYALWLSNDDLFRSFEVHP